MKQELETVVSEKLGTPIAITNWPGTLTTNSDKVSSGETNTVNFVVTAVGDSVNDFADNLINKE